jgi:hypothetical protein
VADSFTNNLNMTKPEVGSSTDTWGTKLNADMDVLDGFFKDDGTGTSTGWNVGVGKIFKLGGTLNTIASGVLNALVGAVNLAAGVLSIKDDADNTKVFKFSAAGITTGTTRTITVPDASFTLVGVDTPQTLTGKTLTDALANTQTAGTGATKLSTCDYANTAAANAAAALVRPGTVRLTYCQTADTANGWLLLDDTTIGSAASTATHKSDSYQNLYNVLYALPDGVCPVVGGRGANAAADWAANKSITLAKVLGRVLGVAGAGASLTARTVGAVVGEETHTLTLGEIPSGQTTDAVLSLVASGPAIGQVGFGGGGGNIYNEGPAVLGGGGGAHNNMQPTSFLNGEIKF